MDLNKENKDPLMVSISCLTYNQEPYIRQCLEGFVMQKTNFRFEAIVHDDASTDGTAAIIREYAEKYPDIIKPIYETENQYSKHDGSLQRIMKANLQGKYVAICEGDDYWIDPYKLQRQVDFMESHPDYTMCFHNAVVFSDTDETAPYVFNDLRKNKDITIDDILERWIVPTASIFYRREAREFYSWSHLVYSGDMLLALQCCSKGKVYFMSQIMSFYRHNTSKGFSLSSQLKNSQNFILDHQIRLYSLFDKETKGRYSKSLKDKIKRINLNYKYSNLRKKSLVLTFLLMPRFTVLRIKNKMKKLWRF